MGLDLTLRLSRPARRGDGRGGAPGRRWAAGPRSLALAALAAGALLPLPAGPAPGLPGGALAAQGPGTAAGSEWFPGRSSFDPLLAAPREVALRGAFLAADREDPAPPARDFRGRNVEADVSLGHRLPVVRLRGGGRGPGGRDAPGGPEVTLGFEVGVSTRFFMETAEKDLVGSDFRVGAPVSARWRGWQARLTVIHVSSHLGDDFVERFDVPTRQTTRDGLELLVARRPASAVRLYAGGEWNFHVNEGVERTAARAGLEWDPDPLGAARSDAGAGRGRASDGPDGDAGEGLQAWPFAAADARVTSRTEGAAVSAAGGLALRVQGVVLRLEARAHAGPTPLGQFRDRDESSAGLGLRIEP